MPRIKQKEQGNTRGNPNTNPDVRPDFMNAPPGGMPENIRKRRRN